MTCVEEVRGTIFQIQRWSVNDGDGIRSTVFFKGCPLRCRWCANPESWKGAPEVLFFAECCVVCGRCAAACPQGALQWEPGVKPVLTGSCQGCGACSAVCPGGARKQMGYPVTVAEVMAVLKRDAIFYRESGGGVTFSGGEPFAQAEFLRALAASCGSLGIDTAVETSGYYDWEKVKDIFDKLDCAFVDIKHMDSVQHRQWTGVDNSVILDNIGQISRQTRTIVRVPLMEEVNATETNIRQMCEFLIRNTRVDGVELLSYHDLGEAKYRAAGGEYHAFTTPDGPKLEFLKEIIAGYGLRVFDFS